MKYYPARLIGTYNSITEALLSAGFNDYQVETLIGFAGIKSSEFVFYPSFEGMGLVATRLTDATAGLWEAFIDRLCDTPAEALRYSQEIDAGAEGMQRSMWAVFIR